MSEPVIKQPGEGVECDTNSQIGLTTYCYINHSDNVVFIKQGDTEEGRIAKKRFLEDYMCAKVESTLIEATAADDILKKLGLTNYELVIL